MVSQNFKVRCQVLSKLVNIYIEKVKFGKKSQPCPFKKFSPNLEGVDF